MELAYLRPRGKRKQHLNRDVENEPGAEAKSDHDDGEVCDGSSDSDSDSCSFGRQGEDWSDEDEEIRGVAAFRPQKTRKFSWTGCICCPADSGHVGALRRNKELKSFKAQSWHTLHQAAEIRRDATYIFLVEEKTTNEDGSLCEPKGFYHKSCYAS